MTTDDLTGAALDEAIARALGWQQILGGWVNPDGGGELMLRWPTDEELAEFLKPTEDDRLSLVELMFKYTSEN